MASRPPPASSTASSTPATGATSGYAAPEHPVSLSSTIPNHPVATAEKPPHQATTGTTEVGDDAAERSATVSEPSEVLVGSAVCTPSEVPVDSVVCTDSCLVVLFPLSTLVLPKEAPVPN